MYIAIESLEKIIKDTKEKKIEGAEFLYRLDDTYDDETGKYTYKPVIEYTSVKTLKGLSEITVIGNSSITLASIKNSVLAVNLLGANLLGANNTMRLDKTEQWYTDEGFNTYMSVNHKITFEFFPWYYWKNQSHVAAPTFLITVDPIEVVEEGITYRLLVADKLILSCVPHTSAMYKYMDKGVVFSCINGNSLFIKKMTYETFPCMVLAQIAHTADINIKLSLQDGCFIPEKQAKLLSAVLEKRVAKTVTYTTRYNPFKNHISELYLSDAKNLMTKKFLAGEIDVLTIGDIKLEKNKATYDKVSLEYEGLSKMVNDTRGLNTDSTIYDMLDMVVFHITRKNRAAAGETTDTVLVNGMPIEIGMSVAFRRSINGMLINASEVVEVARRAFCCTNLDQFNILVKNVSRMSLRVHDILGNGQTTYCRVIETDKRTNFTQEQKETEWLRQDKQHMWKNMPKLKFVRKDNHYQLVVNDEKTLVVSKFIGLLDKINQLPSRLGQYYYDENRMGHYRNYTWAIDELANLLVEFTKVQPPKRKNADGTYTERAAVAKLTKAEAVELIKDADKETAAAILKSKALLDDVVKRTGAEAIEFNNMTGYKVVGKLHTYFVDMNTNQVYNHTKNKAICIVGAGHSVGIGWDETATRILALKNDERTSKQIQTLING